MMIFISLSFSLIIVFSFLLQINLAEVDESTGRMTGGFKTYAICGAIRRMGESDDCINRLAKKDFLIDKKF